MREKAKPFNVKVAVRVRPILAHDRDPRPVVRVDRESTKPSVTVVDPDKEFPGLKQNIDYLRVDYIRERSYEFDYVYGPTQPTDTVFQEAVEPLIGPVLDGQNVTIFAYGQTGSGKTFTITGGSERYEDRGIIPRALSMIFQAFRERSDCSWSAHVSYMEIYNEQGFDLLNESSGAKALQDLPRVRMMEDEHGPRRRPVVQRRLHAIDATRIHQTRS